MLKSWNFSYDTDLLRCLFTWFFSLQAFFTSGAMMNVLETFCIYHITAPGQEAGAKDLPEGYVYPTMDELADQVHFNHEV